MTAKAAGEPQKITEKIIRQQLEVIWALMLPLTDWVPLADDVGCEVGVEICEVKTPQETSVQITVGEEFPGQFTVAVVELDAVGCVMLSHELTGDYQIRCAAKAAGLQFAWSYIVYRSAAVIL